MRCAADAERSGGTEGALGFGRGRRPTGAWRIPRPDVLSGLGSWHIHVPLAPYPCRTASSGVLRLLLRSIGSSGSAVAGCLFPFRGGLASSDRYALAPVRASARLPGQQALQAATKSGAATGSSRQDAAGSGSRGSGQGCPRRRVGTWMCRRADRETHWLPRPSPKQLHQRCCFLPPLAERKDGPVRSPWRMMRSSQRSVALRWPFPEAPI